jgi:hypothetical protein
MIGPRLAIGRAFGLAVLAALSAGARAAACDGCVTGDLALVETAPERQLEIFHQLAAKTVLAAYDTDADGHITDVALVHSRHARDGSRPPERVLIQQEAPDLPHLADADFRMIRHFPKLTGLTVQFQLIPEDGYDFWRMGPN